MSKLNKQLIKAGLYYLIDKDEELFLERMSIYLQERAELMNLLFDGPLPINDEIKNSIEEYIKKTLPCPAYFDSIVSIEIDFTYNFEQLYKVTYKATRFYDQAKNPWKGKPVSDDTYSIPIITESTVDIDPINLCRSY